MAGFDPDYTQALAEGLEVHVRTLAGQIGERHVLRPDALDRAALYAENTLAASGYRVRRETFEASGVCVRNVIAETEPPAGRPFYVIGAHYDTVPGSPGADDNASGVAVLLELASRFKVHPPAAPVRFAAFVNEEPPHFGGDLMGSAVHAAACRAAGERILGMLCLESVGYYASEPGSQRYPPLLSRFYPPSGDFIALVSDLGSRPFASRLRVPLLAKSVALQTAALPRWVPGVSLSDHMPFWRQGYPAAMLTDTAMYRNPNYHGASDVPETLDYGRMAVLTEALAGAFSALADASS